MKPAFLLLATFFFFHPVFSQVDVEYLFSSTSNMNMDKIIHVDGKTIVGGEIFDCNRGSVIAFDGDGEIEWTMQTSGCSTVTDLYFRDSDSTIIAVSYWITGCDVILSDSGPLVFGIGLDGNLKFSIHLSNELHGGLLYGSPSLAVNHKEEIILANGSQLFWLDSTGNNVLLSKEYPDIVYQDIFFYNDSTLVLPSNEGITLLNESGDLKSTINIPQPIIDAQLDGDDLFLLTADKIYRYNLLTASLSEDDRINNSIVATGLILDSNDLYVWGKDPNDDNNALIGQLEKSTFDPLQFISMAQDSLSIDEVFSNGTQLFIIGDIINGDIPFGGNIYESFVKTTAVFNPPVYSASVDVEISNFQVLQRSEVSRYDSLERIYFFDPDHIVFEYDIVNRGSDTLTSVSIVSQIPFTFFCEVFRLFNHLSNLSVPSNEKITIKDSLPASLFHFEDEIRLTAFAPNHRFDSNPADNLLIGTDFIVSSNDLDPALTNFDFSVFPNPASDQINIVFNTFDPVGESSLRLINLSGQVLHTSKLSSSTTQLRIPLQAYPPGIYFLQYLKNEEIMRVKKVVLN